MSQKKESGYLPPGSEIALSERRSDGSFGELDFHQEVHESFIREAQPEAVMMGFFSTIDNRYPSQMPIIYMTISAILVAISGLFTEILTGILDPGKQGRLSPPVILFYRSFFIIVILFVYVQIARIQNVFAFSMIEQNKLICLGISGLFGAIAAWTYIESLDCLPFSEATAIMMLYPLLYSVINFLVFKVAISFGEQLAILSSLVGIYLITRPHEFFTGKETYQEGPFDLPVSPSERILGFVFCIVQAMAFACFGIMVRIIGSTINPLTTITLVLLQSIVISLVLMLFSGGFVFPSLHQVILLCLQAVFFFIGTILSTHAYNTAENKSNILVIVNYSQILYSILIDIFIIGDMPEWLSVIGTIIIVVGGLVGFKLSQQ